MMRDQADGLRRLFGTATVTLTVAAHEAGVIDAYAQIKRVVREQGCGHFRVAVTQARSIQEARTVFDNLQRVAHEYLGVRLEYLDVAMERANGTVVGPRPVPAMIPHETVL